VVRVSLRLSRKNSGVPTVSSSRLICKLTAEGVRNTRSLAFSIVPASTTSTKLRSSSVGRVVDMID